MVTDHVEEFPAILKDLQNRLAGGTLKSYEQIYSGLSETPRVLRHDAWGIQRQVPSWTGVTDADTTEPGA
ncbi:MAG: hypothetical protein CM15mP25_5080 [Gammaproteobacteria bacterium]|nr:MAG: hypothetical protein CM15mP25_5080 [Gammaproteobacteria bacterium]